MTDRVSSRERQARLAGLFYFIHFVIGAIALFLTKTIVVPGDAAATVANVAQHQSLYRLGFAAHLLVPSSYVVVTALLYHLFREVNETVSLTATFFSLLGCAVLSASCIFYLAPSLLHFTGQTSSATLDQQRDLTMLFLNLHGQGFNSSNAFFAFYCLLLGWLIFRSRFMPRALGILVTVAGFGWLAFMWPPFARALSPYVLAPGVVGEGSLTLWLIFARSWHAPGEVSGSARNS